MDSKTFKYHCGFCNGNNTGIIYTTCDQSQNRYCIACCLDCACLFLAPRPKHEELALSYDESYYGQGGDKFGSITEKVLDWFRQRRAKLVHRYLDGKGRVLDIGCGNGRYLSFLGNKGDYELYGIEMDGAPAQRASRISKINLFTDDLKDCGFKPESFDAITLFHVFEHLPEPQKTLLIISRTLKKNGILYISFPNIDSVQARLFKGNWLHLDPPRHLFFFKPADFKALMEKQGFKLLKERHFNPEYNPFGMCQSILNCFSNKRELLYESMKGNIRYAKGPELTLHRIFFYLSFPFFLVTDFVESLFRKGATVEFVFEKQGSRSRGVQGSSDPPQNRRIKILKDYRRLNIRQKSHAPWLHIYKETKRFLCMSDTSLSSRS